MTSSDSWSASDSTISTAFSVPATTRSSGGLQLRGGRVDGVLAIDVAHARGADRAVERDARDGQRGRGADHGGDVGVDFRVDRQRVDDHLDFVVEVFGEQRTQGTVDQAGGQRFLSDGLPSRLKKPPGCGRRRSFLDVVDGQREEGLTRLGLLGGHDGRQDHGVLDRHHDGAGGLASDLAGFQDDRVLAVLERFSHFIEHDGYSLQMKNRGRRDKSRTGHGCVMGSQPRRSLAQTEFSIRARYESGLRPLR